MLPYYSKKQKTIHRPSNEPIDLSAKEVYVILKDEHFGWENKPVELTVIDFKDNLPIFEDEQKQLIKTYLFKKGVYSVSGNHVTHLRILKEEPIEQISKGDIYITLIPNENEDLFFTWKATEKDFNDELVFIKDAFDFGFAIAPMDYLEFIKLAEKKFGPALNPLAKKSGIQLFIRTMD